MDQAFEMVWDHPRGMVQVILPSKTRINFSRESTGFLWSFCNAATMLHKTQAGRDFLKIPLTEAQIRKMHRDWIKSGNVVIKPLDKLPPGMTLEKLIEGQLEGLVI